MSRGMILTAVAALLALALAACASTTPAEPKIVTKEVRVEVVRPCPASLPARPTFTDTKPALSAAPSAEDRYRLMAGNWFTRDARLVLLEGVVAACMKPLNPKP